MAQANRDRHGDQLKSALAMVAVHGLLGYALLTGLTIKIVGRPGETLKLFDIAAETPPEPLAKSTPADAETERVKGAASAPTRKAQAAPVVVPPREIKVDLIPPVAAAPAPAAGSDVSAGAAPQWGPGTGSAGVGTGLGSGAGGAGSGGGIATRARQIAGRIVDSDYPRAAKKARAEGAVLARFSVGTDGRASGCTILESSGHPDLDATTCRLIERRFRFDPARDAHGDLTVDTKAWQQIWWLEPIGRRSPGDQDRD